MSHGALNTLSMDRTSDHEGDLGNHNRSIVDLTSPTPPISNVSYSGWSQPGTTFSTGPSVLREG